MRVAVCSLKGGVGKTTTSVFLSEAASKEGRTLLIDCDPQGSTLRWAEESSGGLSAVVIAAPSRSLGRDIDGIAEGYEHVIIDTPPGEGDKAIVRAAMIAADVALMPLAPTALEIDRLSPTLALAEELGAPSAALLVRCRHTKSRAEVTEALEEADIPMMSAQIPLREAIALSYGSRPTELHGYLEVWAELVEAIGG